MAHSELKLQINIWGRYIDPAAITKKCRCNPTRTFKVQERGKPGHYIYDKAGWEWECAWLETEEATWNYMMNELKPLVTIVQDLRAQDDQLDVSVAVVGYIYHDLLTTIDQLHERKIAPYKLPDTDGDRVELSINSTVIAFLAALGADFDVYIPTVLEDDETTQQL